MNWNAEVVGMKKCKLVIASDAHGYIHGFDQIRQAEPDGDFFLDLGDNFCGDMPTEEFLKTWCSVRGNNDYYRFPKVRNFDIFHKHIRMVHGEDMLWVYPTYKEMVNYMAFDGVDILLLGHTHRRAYVEEKGKIIINPGSFSRSREYDLHEKGLGSYCVLTIYEDGTTEHEFKTIKKE